MTILAFPSPYTPFKGFNNDGSPLAGGLLYSYAAGTVTPLATYFDPGQITTNANPVILNARGEWPVFLPPNVAYKFLLTDSLGNTIPGWPIDNVINSQLITLYGGVDTGVANAYLLNFNAPFSTYTNGIVIYWVPGNNNSGASTVNVNGIGVANIVNPDGSALSANQIVAAQPLQMMYYSGHFILLNGSFVSGALALTGNLTTGNVAFGNASNHTITDWGVVAAAQVDMSVDKGTFTGTFSGMTTVTTAVVSWTRISNWVFMVLPSFSATSNANTMIMTGLPAAITPASGAFGILTGAIDNGSAIDSSAGLQFFPQSIGQIAFYKNHSATGWTTSAGKGLIVQQIFYSLI